MGRYGTVWEGMGGYGTVWGDLGAFEGGTGWYGTGFPRKFLNRPVASTSLVKKENPLYLFILFYFCFSETGLMSETNLLKFQLVHEAFYFSFLRFAKHTP